MRAAVVLCGLTALALVVPGVAVAAQLGVSADRLASGTSTAPPFHATSLTVTPKQANSRPSANDKLVLTLSQPVRTTSVCSGATTAATQTFTGLTVTVTDASPEDLLDVTAGPTTCSAPALGTYALGSGGYTGGAISFPNSSLTVANSSTGSTLTLTLGSPSSTPGPVGAATVLTFTPDAALRDSSARAVSPGTAVTVSKVQF